MPEWRKKPFPVCPKCNEGSDHAGHRDCPYDGKLWIDILTGTVKCNKCNKEWSLEESVHYCSCGAKFKGGELWTGMAAEIGRLGNLTWLRRLGVRKGVPQKEFIGWWKDTSSGCFISTLIISNISQSDDCAELQLLRRYRDEYVASLPNGTNLISKYYQEAPRIVDAISMKDNIGFVLADYYRRYLSRCIKMLENGRNAEALKIYVSMMEELRNYVAR